MTIQLAKAVSTQKLFLIISHLTTVYVHEVIFIYGVCTGEHLENGILHISSQFSFSKVTLKT